MRETERREREKLTCPTPNPVNSITPRGSTYDDGRVYEDRREQSSHRET